MLYKRERQTEAGRQESRGEAVSKIPLVSPELHSSDVWGTQQVTVLCHWAEDSVTGPRAWSGDRGSSQLCLEGGGIVIWAAQPADISTQVCYSIFRR